MQSLHTSETNTASRHARRSTATRAKTETTTKHTSRRGQQPPQLQSSPSPSVCRGNSRHRWKRRSEKTGNSETNTRCACAVCSAPVALARCLLQGAAYEAAIAILRKWLSEHLDGQTNTHSQRTYEDHALDLANDPLYALLADPYPDADQKQKMSEETGLTYGQVQHWSAHTTAILLLHFPLHCGQLTLLFFLCSRCRFINARMRYLRPMLAARQAELEAPKKPDSDLQSVVPLSLSALSSVATYAAPLETAVAHADAEQLASEAAGQVDQTVPAAAAAASSSAASSSPVVPRSTLFDLSRTLLSLSEFAPISDAEGAEARLPRPSVTKHKPKPQHALSAAIFANGQTKAGRVVKRKSTSLEEDGPDAAESSDAAAAAAPAVGIPLSSSDGDDDDDDRNKKRKGPRGVGTRVFDPKQR